VPLNVWFRLRRAVENTSTILLVLSEESNAKTCASLVLRVERENTEWAQENGAGSHTPGCLLQSATHTAEVVRSVVKYKRPRAIDECSSGHSSDATVQFRLHVDRYAAEKPQAEEEVPRSRNRAGEQKERMQNPG